MSNMKRVLVLPGDGIGPEVIRQVLRVVEWMDRRRHVPFDLREDAVGGAAIDKYGSPLADETMALAADADAVLLGAVGGPKWDDLPFAERPERGLLRLRKELDLYANLRPAIVFDPLVDASTLKPEIVRGLDLMIVRELTGGVYFGQPRGIEDLGNGQRRGTNTHTYTTSEIRRVAQVAFELAGRRKKKLCSADKANVMEAGRLWRDEVQKLGDSDYPDIALEHMYADSLAMQLLRHPKEFDVIVTDNLFGDILSDEAAMLTGSLGMLPSASLGDALEDGTRRAMYEPVHGSAPDLAGKDLANPIATLLSFAMMLRWSFELEEDAVLLEQAVERVLQGGVRTADIMAPGMARVSTTVMGDSIIRELDKLAA
jgi:3-isopropylmalate dehydrogenase